MPDLVGHDNKGGAGLERGEGFPPINYDKVIAHSGSGLAL